MPGLRCRASLSTVAPQESSSICKRIAVGSKLPRPSAMAAESAPKAAAQAAAAKAL